jgi:hypothetical protein
MDPELRQYLDHLSARIDERFEHLEAAVAPIQVFLQRQDEDLLAIAEGLLGTNERIDHVRAEVALQFDQVRSQISPPYSDLNRRIKTLESWRERSERDPVELVRERFGKPKS